MFEISPLDETSLHIHVNVNHFESTNAQAFKETFEENCPPVLTDVSIDLSEVDMIDSSAIGALLSVQKRLHDQSNQVSLIGVKAPVLSVIELLRLNRVFRLQIEAGQSAPL